MDKAVAAVIIVFIVSTLISLISLGYAYSYLTLLEERLKQQRALVKELMSEIMMIAQEVKKMRPNVMIANTITKVVTLTLTRVIVAYSTLTHIITSTILKPLTIKTTETSIVVLNNTIFITTTSVTTRYVTLYKTITLTTSTCPLALTLKGQDIAVLNLTKPAWLEIRCEGRGTVALGSLVQYYIIKESTERWRLLDAQTIIPCSGLWRGITKGIVTVLVLSATATIHTWPLG